MPGEDRSDEAVKPSSAKSRLVEGETVGVVTYLGSNKRGPSGPLPPIGSQVFLGARPTPAARTETTDTPLGALLAYCRRDGRVCPHGVEWTDLCRLIPGAPAPLILAAGHVSNEAKRARLAQQLALAQDQGVLPAADAFLRGLPPDRWTLAPDGSD